MTHRQALPHDPDRFAITERRLIGPLYTVSIRDKVTGRAIPQTGAILLSRASVERQIRWSIDRYQRRHPDLFPREP